MPLIHVLNKRSIRRSTGKVGGCLITGNEDGIRHCAMNEHMAPGLQEFYHRRLTGWISEARAWPSYGDDDERRKSGFGQ